MCATSEGEAVRTCDELRRQLRLGVDLTAPPRTLAAWLTEWLQDIKAHDETRASTLRRNREVIDTHLIPALGSIKLDKLTARDVQRFLTGIKVKSHLLQSSRSMAFSGSRYRMQSGWISSRATLRRQQSRRVSRAASGAR